MGSWLYLVYFLYPIPLICLLLLCLPFAERFQRIQKIIISFTSNILFKPILGKTLNIYQISTFISSILFLLCCYDTRKATLKLESSTNISNELKEERLRGHKWRSERNFWISFMSLVLWLLLYRVHKMVLRLDILNDNLKEKQK